MKTYDEVYENIITATDAHRQKVRKIQSTVSISAVFLTCIFGVGMFVKITRPDARPSAKGTTTVTMTTEEMSIMDTMASAPASSDSVETHTTISRRLPEELMIETTADGSTISTDTDAVESMLTSLAIPAAEVQEEETTFYTDNQEEPDYPATVTSAAGGISVTLPPETGTFAEVTTKATEKTTPAPSTTTVSTTKPSPPSTELATEPEDLQPTEPTRPGVSPEAPMETTTFGYGFEDPARPDDDPSEQEPLPSEMQTYPANPPDFMEETTTETWYSEESETTTTSSFPETNFHEPFLSREEWREAFGDAAYQYIDWNGEDMQVTVEITETIYTVTITSEGVEVEEVTEDIPEPSGNP